MFVLRRSFRLGNNFRVSVCKIHDVAQQYKHQKKIDLPSDIRTSYNDPRNHTANDLGKFYTLPKEHVKIMSGTDSGGHNKAFPKHYTKLANAFCEHSMLIRQPAMEIIDVIKNYDHSNAVPKFLLYGDRTVGKTMSLQHVVHYCISDGWMILPLYFAWDYLGYKTSKRQDQCKETLVSQWNNERVDQPDHAVQWLSLFKQFNKDILDKVEVSKQYEWTVRDKTEKGSTLRQLVDQGLMLPAIATDVAGAVMKEIREGTNRPKVAVVIDAVNALFVTSQLHFMFSSDRIEPDQLSLLYNMKKMLRKTWTNGAVVTAINDSNPFKRETIYFGEPNHHDPYKILGKDGFDCMNPVLPVEVPKYTEDEMLATLAYYYDRKWIGNKVVSSDGVAECLSVCCGNPGTLSHFVRGIY